MQDYSLKEGKKMCNKTGIIKNSLGHEKVSINEEIRKRIMEIAKKNNLLSQQVVVVGKDLTVEEAIGKPRRQDFPLQEGKEKLLQANFMGTAGQAYTDQTGYFYGSLSEILDQPLDTNFNKAVFYATLNAVLRHLNLIDKTIHCKDEEPEECSKQIIPFIKEKYGNPKIALIGLQPSLLEALAPNFSVRVLDMNPDSIGKVKFGIKVEDGYGDMIDVLDWCDFILATGSTLSNGTIENYFIKNKPTVFYGTTIAGAAYLMGWDRYCVCSK